MNESIFRCPCKFKATLERNGSFFQCQNSECLHHNKKKGFHIKDGIPVLISEENTDTVFELSNLKGAVKRQENQLILRLRKFLLGTNSKTTKNCSQFIKLLKKNSTKPRLLIIGGGEIGSGANSLYESNLELICTDIYLSEHTNIVADAHYLPFKDHSFDGVWIQAVLEHVVDPFKVVKEIHRVLNDNGYVYSEVPFMQPVHEGAYDFTRFTLNGHRYLFKNFESISLGPLRSSEDTLSWSIRYFFWSLFRSRLIAKIVGALSSLTLRPFAFILSKEGSHDSTTGTFFLGLKSQQAITQKEALSSYEGHFN